MSQVIRKTRQRERDNKKRERREHKAMKAQAPVCGRSDCAQAAHRGKKVG